MRRSVAVGVLVALTSTACGGSAADESSPAVTLAPTSSSTDEPAPVTPEAASEPEAESPAEEPVEEPVAEEPVEEPVAEEPAPEPEMLWPDDGCSADNSPTPAATAEGPAPSVALRPESVDGPLPDLAVRRINCKGGWENLRNELPADRPLLVWFWAPH